jgi:hypothetical protein
MLVPKNFTASVARTIGRGVVALPMLTLVVSGCSRDELAPDCFEINPDTGVCLIPDPGGTEPGINCGTFPEGAVGAEYSFTPAVGGGSGNFNMWMATGLPPGLSIDPNTGEISGVPTEPMAFNGIELSMFDAGKGEGFEAQCGELVINDRLNSNLVMMEPNHCIPSTASKEEMLALLQGGDGTDLTCTPLSTGDGACALGDGNGRIAPGINFDASTCTHSGTVAGDRRGTWVWMVEVNQSGFSTTVPFCATNDVDAFHDILLTVNAVTESDLSTGLLGYDPNASVQFGGGSHQWSIENTADCPGCTSYGFRFNFSCSPFDNDPPDWTVTLLPDGTNGNGFTHEMEATGPTPASQYATRPFTASFEMSYCTAADSGPCASDNPDFEQNAQTQYHFSVVAFPTDTP